MKLLNLPAVTEKVGLKKSAIYARIKNGTFPQPVRLGTRSIAFVEDEVEQWINALPRGTADSQVYPQQSFNRQCLVNGRCMND